MSVAEYYKELSRLRGELIGALMSGNRSIAGVLIFQIEALGPPPPENTPAKCKLTPVALNGLNLAFADFQEEIRKIFEEQ